MQKPIKRIYQIHKIINHDHKADDHVRSRMNIFVISMGSCISPLTDKAIATAQKIGTVKVDVGDTSCKVPNTVDYVHKVRDKGAIG